MQDFKCYVTRRLSLRGKPVVAEYSFTALVMDDDGEWQWRNVWELCGDGEDECYLMGNNGVLVPLRGQWEATDHPFVNGDL